MTSAYERFSRPLLVRRLRAAGLDVSYERASGDLLFYRDADERERVVLDLVGGFGASLLGHNHPEILRTVRQHLDEERPVLAQASRRVTAGRLAERLASLARESFGRDYIVTFASTGTEAVEAAIKHAELERRRRLEAIFAEHARTVHAIRRGLRDQSVRLSPALFATARKCLGELTTLDELFALVGHQARSALGGQPVFVALERAFHGKTSGSLQLTHRLEYRDPWSKLGPRSIFVPAADPSALDAALGEHVDRYLALAIDTAGQVSLVERECSRVAALFVEPIQGEGGIRELDAETVRGLRERADRHGFPLVADEIQSGMGRTGRFFAMEHSGVAADIVLLSKSLGGSIAKISAVLVDRARYIEDFGYLHTSTFADDELSCEVGLTVLDCIENDGLIERCRSMGERFLEALRALQKRFPDQLVEVRGRGLMIGVELASFADSASPLLRVLSDQELLGFVVSGYLLHEEGVRVAPALSAQATIRVEPSAYLRQEDIDLAVSAIENLLTRLRAGDVFGLIRYLVDRTGEEVPAPRVSAAPRERESLTSEGVRVGFLAHFLEPSDLTLWEKGLAPFGAADCERFFERTRGVIEPFVVGGTRLHSTMGSSVHASVICLPFAPAQVVAAMRSGTGQWALDLVHQGVEVARQLGCSIVGFGGYTSIITNNCRAVEASDLTLTSGNSLTAAAAIDSAFLAATRLGLKPRVMGVVGAVGNIGRVLAEVAADEVDEIVLVGRALGRKRLERAAAALYASCVRKARLAPDSGGLAGALARTGVLADIDGESDLVGAQIFDALESRGDGAPIRIYDDLSALRQCNLIISATNAARPVILPEHIATDRQVVISDVAVPMDVDPTVRLERPNAVVLRGGIVRTPMAQDVTVDGMTLRPGEIYGCFGETLLLGLAGIGENYSFGELEASRVRRIRELAQMHGFRIEENPA